MLVHTESAASKLEQESKEKGVNYDEKQIQATEAKNIKQLLIKTLRLLTAPVLLCWGQAEAANIGSTGEGHTEHGTREKA